MLLTLFKIIKVPASDELSCFKFYKVNVGLSQTNLNVIPNYQFKVSVRLCHYRTVPR